MLYRLAYVLLLLMVCGASGCARKSAAAPKQEPLSVEQWKALQPSQKYDVDTLERVKAGEPRFQDEEAWDQFVRAVMLPAKRREIAAGLVSP